MTKRFPYFMFALCTALVLLQVLACRSWEQGLLLQMAEFYRGFGQPIPSATSFGIATSKAWWLAPAMNATLLSVVSLSAARSRLLLVPFSTSLIVLLAMAYVTYPVPEFFKLGQSI